MTKTTNQTSAKAQALKTVKRAKEIALAELNKNRKASGFSLAKSVPPLWWKMYGSEWISIAEKETV